MLRPRFFVGMVSVGLIIAGAVSGQNYPNKPVRIVTTAAGSGGDFPSRIIAQGISGPLGQPVIIDNKSGGLFASETVAKAPPDGHTLVVNGASLWISPLLRKVSYDPVGDFSPISLLVREVFIVALHPSVAANNVKELIALAKARPGELNFGSGAIGGSNHLAGELFKSMAGVNIVHVPSKGSPLAIIALVSGEVHLTFTDAGLVVPHVKSGKFKALAVTSAQPSALFPGLPTVAASGLPGYEAGGMTGLWAPAKTPGAIVNRLNQEIVRVLNLPDVKERFMNAGVETVGNSPAQFAAIIKSDMARTAKTIKDAGIKVD